MNKQKLEHLIETFDMVRRYQTGQSELVEKEIKKLQGDYKEMTGHYYHFMDKTIYKFRIAKDR